jgi:hypothetical protein
MGHICGKIRTHYYWIFESFCARKLYFCVTAGNDVFFWESKKIITVNFTKKNEKLMEVTLLQKRTEMCEVCVRRFLHLSLIVAQSDFVASQPFLRVSFGKTSFSFLTPTKMYHTIRVQMQITLFMNNSEWKSVRTIAEKEHRFAHFGQEFLNLAYVTPLPGVNMNSYSFSFGASGY